MKTPFVFGRIATGENFTDRTEETEHLVNNFRSVINTMIISPRRWGKSSLVHKAALEAQRRDKDLRICEVDLFNVRSEKDFYNMLMQCVLKATTSKWDDIMNTASTFLKSVLPKIMLSTEPGMGFSIELDWERAKNNIDEIIDLPEKIAIEKGIRIVICVDEFQNISYFSDALYFQKRLRAHWQRHQNVSYCLYGSKRHMLMDVFTNSSMPFYKFGDLIFLNKIGESDLKDFITERFEASEKRITDSAAALIPQLVECHPYYTQQLAQLSWLRTQDECTDETVHDAHKALIGQLSLLFSTLTQPLTNQQVAYMHALVDGCKSITSTDSMKRYGITSAMSVSRSKAKLIELDILDDAGGTVKFQDPVYEYWLKHTYFKGITR